MPKRAQPAKSDGLQPQIAAITLMIVLAFSTIVRLRLLDLPLERDEGEYAYAGQLMLQGIPPYSLVYNMKFPGTYAAYALIMALFGQSIAGIRIGLILVTSATTLLLYVLARRMFGLMGGVVAATTHALLALTLSATALYAHATHFVMLPAVAAMILLLGDSRLRLSGQRRAAVLHMLAAGALLALATLMKQPGAAFALFAFLYLLVEKRFRDAGLLAAGGAIVAALTALALYAAGVFGRFWFWTIDYAREYVSTTTLAEGWQFFRQTAGGIVSYAPFLWLVIAAGVALPFIDAETRRWWKFVIGFAAASLLATTPGLYFRTHYFILTFPAAALLAAAGAAALTNRLRNRAIPGIVFAAIVLATIGQQWDIFMRMPADRITRAIHGDSPFIEAIVIGDYLREHTRPADRIAILGSEPEIDFYAQRKSATGYIYTYPLVERQRFAHRMQQEMIAEIERANPLYLVSVNVNYSWLTKPGADRTIFEWAERKVNSSYRLEGIVDETPGETTYVWGDAAAHYEPKSSSIIMIFRRR